MAVSIELLDRTRKLTGLLQNNESITFVFSDICKILSEELYSNALVFSNKGKVLGRGYYGSIDPIQEMIPEKVGSFVDQAFNDRLLGALSTKENVNLSTLGFSKEVSMHYHAMLTPITIAGNRLGTLFLYKESGDYDIDDIILAEFGVSIVGLEMLRSVTEENAEEERRQLVVKSAISTLSYSELEAIRQIFKELDGMEGVLVASKVADRVGITRSVIVNALRKFESAGVIESRSSGMKGTYIKVVNENIFDELKRVENESATREKESRGRKKQERI